MKLGTQTGSLNNHILSRMVVGQPEPEVGMGATILGWTDRHAATVVKIETVRKRLYVTVQRDKAKRLDNNGMSECQEWAFEPNPNGPEETFERTPGGMWAAVVWNPDTKRMNRTGGHGLRIGERSEYHDFSF